jgi:hypothetical protein
MVIKDIARQYPKDACRINLVCLEDCWPRNNGFGQTGTKTVILDFFGIY